MVNRATLGHSPMGKKKGGATNRLDRLPWVQQPTASNSGSTSYCSVARQPIIVRANNRSNDVIFDHTWRSAPRKRNTKLNKVILNSTSDQPRRRMATQHKSKEFVSSSDSSDLSDGGQVTVGFGEPERIAKRDKNQDVCRTKASRPSVMGGSSAQYTAPPVHLSMTT